MNIDDLLTQATAVAGLGDFGDDEHFGGDHWRTGLSVLVRSLDDEARLNDIGHLVIGGELQQYLTNRLRIVDHHRKHPELCERDVTPPIVIIGQARTGTTMLFDLLAQDPRHRAPLTWEVDQPLPPPQTATYLTDPRINAREAEFELIDGIIPEFRSVHQLGARLAQECVRITGSAFTSAIFPTQYRVPTYLDWVLHDAVTSGASAAAYVWHRRFLEVLQSEHPGEAWLLKTPFHTWTLPQLLAEYPNAQVVQTHRDPARIMASVTSLIAMLRSLASDEIDPVEIAEEFSEIILDGLERTVDARISGTVRPERAVDVQFSEMMARPVETAVDVYARLGLTLSPEVHRRMEEFAAGNDRDSHGGHSYTFDDTGLDLASVQARTKRYVEHFEVPVEPFRR